MCITPRVFSSLVKTFSPSFQRALCVLKNFILLSRLIKLWASKQLSANSLTLSTLILSVLKSLLKGNNLILFLFISTIFSENKIEFKVRDRMNNESSETIYFSII